MYGGGKKIGFLVSIKTEPKNVSLKDVDIYGNPEEKEVNIINFNKTEVISIQAYDK